MPISRPILRWFWRTLVLLSTLFFLLNTTLWLRSYRDRHDAYDCVVAHTNSYLVSCDGILMFATWYDVPPYITADGYRQISWSVTHYYLRADHFLGIGFDPEIRLVNDLPGARGWMLFIPHLHLAVLFAPLPALQLTLWLLRRRHPRAGGFPVSPSALSHAEPPQPSRMLQPPH